MTHRQIPGSEGEFTAPDPPRVTRRRIAGLDGPRGLSALAILTVHVTAHYSQDTASSAKLQLLGEALIFFFALSGFLLFLPIVRSLFQGEARQPNVRQFALHRLMRIYPGYLVIFLISNFVLQTVYLKNAQETLVVGTDGGSGMITDPATLLSNVFLVQTYIPGLIQTGINPSWSLTLEYAFYISLPIVGAGLFALRRRTRMRPVSIAMIAPVVFIVLGTIGKALAEWLAARNHIDDVVAANYGANWSAVILRSFLGGSDTFAFGMAAAVIFVAVEAGVVGPAAARRIRRLGAVALLPSLLVMLVLLAMGLSYEATFAALAAGLIILVIVLPLASGERSKIAEALDWMPFQYLGRISLGVYLWHFPLMLALGRWGLFGGDSWGGLIRNWVLLTVVTIVFATATYQLIEKPAVRYARKYKSR